MSDKQILNDLAKEYAELAARKDNEKKRELWSAHFSKKRTRPPLVVTFGGWNKFIRDVFFAEGVMKCKDPFYYGMELRLRMMLLHGKITDDYIFEPWIQHPAKVRGEWNNFLGVKFETHPPAEDGGAWSYMPPLKTWDDMKKLKKPGHFVFKKETDEDYEKLAEAVSPYLTAETVKSTPYLTGLGDIVNTASNLRGLEQIMVDMYDSPKELHELMKFLSEALLESLTAAEAAGDINLTDGNNQVMPYSQELPRPKAHTPAKLSQIWGFFCAQEYTLVSPDMHEEFGLNYQLPIMEKYGHTAYGCCEDLSIKVKMLRKVKNLRQIGAAPVADLKKCAENIGTDYCISWRPNPTDMVCGEFNEEKIRKIFRQGLDFLKGTNFHIVLKDVESVEGDVSRLWRWADIVNQELDKAGY